MLILTSTTAVNIHHCAPSMYSLYSSNTQCEYLAAHVYKTHRHGHVLCYPVDHPIHYKRHSHPTHHLFLHYNNESRYLPATIIFSSVSSFWKIPVSSLPSTLLTAPQSCPVARLSTSPPTSVLNLFRIDPERPPLK